MKTRPGYFFWILALAFGLMGLIAAAQVLTKKNITGLKKGNQDAAGIFTINNRFEELVNLSFEINAKLTTTESLPVKRQSLVDSLNMLGYNASLLEKLGMRPETKTGFEKLNQFIDTEVETGHIIINAERQTARDAADSLRNKKIADSIYNAALSIQKFLEKDMQTALESNTQASSRLSGLNKTLALIAIAAILILCAIIINRHLKQVQLIKELEKATAAAQESALIKDQFLANMSHEIRTPLNAIKGFSRLLSLTDLSKEQKEYAGIINESSSNLLIIVNDILDISKMEANKLRIESKNFDLNKLLATLKGMFRKQAEDKGLKYKQLMADGVPFNLKGDPDRLLQILINLVGNAIKFTHTGSVEVSVRVQEEQKNKIILDFEVCDTGVGIPADKQHIVFSRFEQLHGDEKDLIHGTGLGLSIVKTLVELMGGTVSLISEAKKGARFNVRLPFELVQLSVSDKEETVLANVHPDKPRCIDTSILVVEDNSINQLLIKKILEDTGIAVVTVSNGQEALDILPEKKFDLIFLDIQMPIMDGYTTAKNMRINLVSTPIIAMTAFAMPGEKQKCIAAGMNDYLAKPIEATEVYRILTSYLAHKQEAEGVSSQVDFENLLKLTGGDNQMAYKIMNEIAIEIPGTIKKLNLLKVEGEFEEIKSLCHYMLSSYSPIGSNSMIVTKITSINKAATEGKREMVTDSMSELEILLNNLQKEIASIENSQAV